MGFGGGLLDWLKNVNDPLGQFGEGELGQQAQDWLDTLTALGISPESATDLIRANLLEQFAPDETARTGSASALLSAQSSMLNAQENMRQGAYDRVADRLRLLQATDQLQDARRENAMAALIQAAPLLVAPGTEFSPGFEPGGPAQQLSALVGGNVQPQPLQTAPLPLGDFLNEPRSVTPEMVNRDLGALMGG